MKKTFMRAKEYWFNLIHSKHNKVTEGSASRQYWLNLMRSTQNKISQGAANFFKIITFARGENWRRKNVKK